MLVFPQFNPVAVHLGPLAVRWYGLMYLVGFLAFLFLGRRRARQHILSGWRPDDVDDLLFYGVLGVVIGGRLGQVLFYDPGYYFSQPLEIIAVWKGGMSFHGGFIGVLLAILIWARKQGRSFLEVADFVAPLAPIGLFFGRIGNFINGELWGRPAPPDLPWAMIFPQVDNLPRHPSQIYEALGEGLLLFIVLWWFTAKPRRRGAASGAFLVGYGLLRSLAEYFREPDTGIFGHSYIVSMGQWLSLPMIVAGIVLLIRARKQ
jgi:phosphatidylglycerol:prolipoprotein diacylglycerol transferase